MTPLPPAFARLATVLELSSGFSLSFVTGPRDHVDSVYLRLVRALGDAHECVRHRVDRDGVNLRDVLGGGGERPRVVFVSGLERMPDRARADATARLNLVRDSWGPYPAQVIVWLPSWGLAEFRRLAPDLFDWRSNLTVLHDADLPVGDEEQYLVWAAERHARREHTGLRTDILTAIAMTDRATRLVLAGYGAAERDIVLRDATAILARTRLHDPPDLDLSLRHGPVRFAPALAPVLLRATELPGVQDPLDLWLVVARAAGVPGPETAAPILSALAVQRQLVVLLDGVDQLPIPDDGPVGRFFARLTGTPALLVALAAGEPPAQFSSWERVQREAGAPRTGDDDTLQPYASLAWLLASLFEDPDSLILLAAHLFGPDVSSELSPSGSRDEVAEEFVLVCRRQGLLDAAFFAELARIRPHRARDIDDVARAWLAKQ